MYLVCDTNTVGLVDDVYAVLQLTTAQAAKLLRLRALIKLVHEVAGEMPYSVEFFNGMCTFGQSFANDTIVETLDQERGQWQVVLSDPQICVDWTTCVEMLRVTEAGILWTGAPKHASGEFETPLISWGELAQLAAGDSPFTILAVALETEAEAE